MTKPKRLTESIEFNKEFGWFHHMWALTEATLDFAIGKFLRLNGHETHILTAGMQHGRKAMLLRSLISRGNYPNKSELLRTLKIIQNESLRNVFAHSYIGSDAETIFFLERNPGGPYKAKGHPFSMKKFKNHVSKFVAAAIDFEKALDVGPGEIETFQLLALSVR